MILNARKSILVKFSSNCYACSTQRNFPINAKKFATCSGVRRKSMGAPLNKGTHTSVNGPVRLYPSQQKPSEESLVYVGPPLKDSEINPGFSNAINDIDATLRPFTDIPKAPLRIGLLGLLPYVCLSATSSVLAWKIASTHNMAFRTELKEQIARGFMDTSLETTYQLLELCEKLQIGYGAVIISFIGAIHWGLELAGYNGFKGSKRYLVGIIAPIIAWPSVLLPTAVAINLQFGAFVFMYGIDSLLASRGWTPSWYGPYRFALTLVVGICLATTLIIQGLLENSSEGKFSTFEKLKYMHHATDEKTTKTLGNRIDAEQAYESATQRILDNLEKDDDELSRQMAITKKQDLHTKEVRNDFKVPKPIELHQLEEDT